MTEKLAKKLRKKNLRIAGVDEETAELLKDIARKTDEYPSDIIKAAVVMLAKSLGHQVVLRDPKSDWELIINGLRGYKPRFKLDPKDEQQ